MFLPAEQTGSPMTYMLKGKQYIVLAIGGRGFTSEFIAFKLPGGEAPPPRRRQELYVTSPAPASAVRPSPAWFR